MTELTPEQRETLLFPCACGHTLNDHGSLVACWRCEDDGDECSTSFEALLAARIATMLDEARREALRDAADAWQQGEWTVLTDPIKKADVPVLAAANVVTLWLRCHAALSLEGDR